MFSSSHATMALDMARRSAIVLSGDRSPVLISGYCFATSPQNASSALLATSCKRKVSRFGLSSRPMVASLSCRPCRRCLLLRLGLRAPAALLDRCGLGLLVFVVKRQTKVIDVFEHRHVAVIGAPVEVAPRVHGGLVDVLIAAL